MRPSAPVSLPLLRLANVTKRYAPGRAPAVDGLSLEVAEGEIVALLGPSGCGKTTTLRLVAGFETPDAGTVSLRGEIVAGEGRHVPPEARGVGIVFQDYALFPHLTVADNVRFGLHRMGRGAGTGAWARRSRWSGSRRSPPATPTSCRAGSSSGWRWRARSRRRPPSCCWTSPSRTSTPTSARRCATRSRASCGARAPPPSS